MRNIYIATHGNFSKGLKDSLEMIVGESAQKIQTYSLYPGESAADFAQELRIKIEENKETEHLILGDLFGASVVTALIELVKYPNVILLSGVNLNLALEVVLSRAETLTDEVIDAMIDNARQGCMKVKVVETENEDF